MSEIVIAFFIMYEYNSRLDVRSSTKVKMLALIVKDFISFLFIVQCVLLSKKANSLIIKQMGMFSFWNRFWSPSFIHPMTSNSPDFAAWILVMLSSMAKHSLISNPIVLAACQKSSGLVFQF